jgi:plastocyanin
MGDHKMNKRILLGLLATCGPALGLIGPQSPALADDSSIIITLKDNRFTPDMVEIPAGKKVKLIIRNQDQAAEEFDSGDLRREKVIPGGGEGTVFIGPLEPGTYSFLGEFHPDTAKGRVVVKP